MTKELMFGKEKDRRKSSSSEEDSYEVLGVDESPEDMNLVQLMQSSKHIIDDLQSTDYQYRRKLESGTFTVTAKASTPSSEPETIFKAVYDKAENVTKFSCSYKQEHEAFLIKMISALNSPKVKKCPNVEFAIKLLTEMNQKGKPIQFHDDLIAKFQSDEKFNAALAENQKLQTRQRSNSRKM